MCVKELMLRGNAMRQKDNLYSFQKAGIRALEKRLENYGAEKRRLRVEKDALYESYALKEISLAEYQKRAGELEERLSFLADAETEAAKRLHSLEDEYQKAEADMRQIIRYSHIEKLTEEVADVFIKRIYVYTGRKVEIEWDFSIDRESSQCEGG